MRRAILSVSDKTGLIPFGKALVERGFELVSTGGTARSLTEAGLPVVNVSDVTGFPEMMDGRVKTLHPLVHGGLLGRAGIDDAVMAAHGIATIDLLVLNLYPFERVSADPDSTLDEIVENIKKRNGVVEYVLFDNEGHGFTKKANEIRAYKAILDFLDRYLKNGDAVSSR